MIIVSSVGGGTTISRSISPYSVTVQKEAIKTYEESVNTMTFILGSVGAVSLLSAGAES